jgi:cobalamin biosynthesis protein CobD/CbiB
MAGLLGVRLAKEGHYELGEAERPLRPQVITEAWTLASIASLLSLGLTLALILAGSFRD